MIQLNCSWSICIHVIETEGQKAQVHMTKPIFYMMRHKRKLRLLTTSKHIYTSMTKLHKMEILMFSEIVWLIWLTIIKAHGSSIRLVNSRSQAWIHLWCLLIFAELKFRKSFFFPNIAIFCLITYDLVRYLS